MSADVATVAGIVADCMEMVPAIPAPGGVRATIVVALQVSSTRGREPMAAEARLQSAPNLDPASESQMTQA